MLCHLEKPGLDDFVRDIVLVEVEESVQQRLGVLQDLLRSVEANEPQVSRAGLVSLSLTRGLDWRFRGFAMFPNCPLQTIRKLKSPNHQFKPPTKGFLILGRFRVATPKKNQQTYYLTNLQANTTCPPKFTSPIKFYQTVVRPAFWLVSQKSSIFLPGVFGSFFFTSDNRANSLTAVFRQPVGSHRFAPAQQHINVRMGTALKTRQCTVLFCEHCQRYVCLPV